MSTIGDLCVTSSVSSDDKLPIWQNANGVTRALPISVLDSRYLTQDDVALLAASATVETFVANVDFTPGVSLALTLANQYYSSANIEVFFDAAFQGPDQYSLAGLGLVFVSPIPVGVQNVYVRGGAARLVGTPSDGTVTTVKIVDGAVTLSKLASQSVNDSKIVVGSKLYNRINGVIFATDPQFGATGNGVTNDAPALNAALAYCAANGKTLFVPAGTYLCNSQLSVTGSVQMQGECVTSTFFNFPTNQGFLFTIPDQFHSVHLRDFTVLAGALGTGNSAIKLTSSAASIPNPANTQLSDITNVNIYGADGAGNLKYFATQIEVQFVSNVNIVNVMGTGTNTLQGVGFFVHGSSALNPVVFNLTGCTFNFLNVGVSYGDYVQGLTLTQVNITGCSYGVNSAASLHALVLLAISNSQFNCFIAGVNVNTEISDLTINGSTFYVPGPSTGIAAAINLIRTLRYSIVGNSFTGYNTIANSNGMVVGTNIGSGIITGNSFDALTTGIFLQSTSSSNNVQSNVYRAVTTPVNNAAGGANTVGGGSM